MTGQFVTSTPIQTDKSSKSGIHLKKTPRQKLKKKKHTPKVIRDDKPRRILKRKDSGAATPSPKKKKHAREKIGDSRSSAVHINNATPPIKDVVTIMEKCLATPHVQKQGDDLDIVSKFTTSQLEVKSCRRRLNLGAIYTEDGKVADQQQQVDQTKSQALPSPGCKLVDRKSQILDRITSIGRDFPIKFKKRRTKRKTRMAATKMAYMLSILCPRDFYISYPRDSRKNRTMKRNVNCFESILESQELEIPNTHHALVDSTAIEVKCDGGGFANVDRRTSDGEMVEEGQEKPKIRAKGHGKRKGTLNYLLLYIE